MSRREILAGAMLWLTVLLANLGTATRSPTAWHDEVYFADPAIHFAEGEGFRTTAWTLVGEDEFWPGLVPAYGFLLGGWFKWVGSGLWQVRALPILLAGVAAGWIWVTSRRRGHVGSTAIGYLLLAALLCGSGVSFSYRSGRADGLAMLWWAAAYAVLAVERKHVRAWALVVLGIIAPWCGMFMAPAVGVAGLSLVLILGRSWITPVASCWAGFATGTLAMMGFYKLMESWDDYVLCFRYYQDGILSPHFNLRLDGFRDPSLLLVMMGLFGCALAPTMGGHARRVAAVTLAAILATGFLAALSAKWPVYYTWLAFFPGILVLAHAISMSSSRLRPLLVAVLALAITAGIPARIGVCLLEWGQRDYARVERFVNDNFRAGDHAVCDPSAYFALREVVGKLYPRATDRVADMPVDAKRSVTCACVRPEVDVGKIVSVFGGRWVQVATLDGGATSLRLGKTAPYRLVAYRRVE